MVFEAVMEAVSMTFALTVWPGGAETAKPATAAQAAMAVITPKKFRRNLRRQMSDAMATRSLQMSQAVQSSENVTSIK
ncbi:MAG: hypothetical protein NVS4B6_01000 [Mycobacterium sp.]